MHQAPYRSWTLLLLWLTGSGAQAAGGHFEVDDATMLGAGRCQLETWAFRGKALAEEGQHLGSACAFGGIEWGLNLDRLRTRGSEAADTWGPGLKWVFDALPQRLSLGLALGAARPLQGGGGTVATAYLPVTAWLDPTLQLHANLGADREPQLGSTRRLGLAAEWAPNEHWSFTLERRLQLRDWRSRAGVRYSFTPTMSVDLGVARAAGHAVLAAGFNWEWER
ncbi:hypothetical protein [Aquabacterium sp.]|uniref:hypothetical protein n=1 Tax=Aquabacterium sp. TaxID=1872578 RepID=UPI0037832218